jgi:hypothetical protein
MANGASVLQLVHPESAPTEELGQRVGIAMADAVAVISRGCYEFGWGGGLTVPTKALGADRIADLYTLLQAIPTGVDFPAIARSEGRRVLQERHGGGLPEPMLDVLLDGTLEIVDRVATYMRLTAN